MKLKNVYYLNSGRIFLLDCNGYPIECTEMRDVAVDGKNHIEVRESLDPHVIWKHLVDYKNKWLLTVSTQKGCNHNCLFCDVATLPFKGNLTQEEIEYQVSFLLKNTDYVKECDKVKIGFARMGEPAHNLTNVLNVMRRLPEISKEQNKNMNWLPCFNTILPLYSKFEPIEVLEKVIELKEIEYNGFLHLQISCNSTSEDTRKKLFGGSPILSLEEIINYVKKKEITNRTVTLNFIVMKDIEVDVSKLQKMGLTGDKFAVKLIPLNKTNQGDNYNLQTYANYSNYEKLLDLKQQFTEAGIPTVVDAIAKCEEAGLCCGQLAHIHQ
jgi:23S rRNA (adenine2503-C2)-methyltransferase